MSKTAAPLAGLGFALLSATAFGAVAPVAKLAYDRGAEALPLLGIRFTVATLLLWMVHRIRGKTLAIGRGPAIRLLLLGGIAYASETWLFFSALELAPASVVSLVFYSFPLITAVIAFFAKLEPFRATTVVALFLGTAGVVSIFGVAGTDLRGPLLALGAAGAVAVYFILAGIFMRGIQASVAATWTAGGAAITLSIAALASGQAMPAAALPGATTLALLTVVAFVALYAAIERAGSARTAIAQMFEPVVTVTLAALLLNEEITLRVLLGAALIVSSLPVLSTRRRVAPRAPDPV